METQLTTDICCWQCTEYCINFTHILNIIIELKKKKISSSFDNIFERINAGDEIVTITEDELTEILQYACDRKYVNTHKYNSKLSYRVNEKLSEEVCNFCGEILVPYTYESTPAERVIDFIEMHTFNVLVNEVKALKDTVNNSILPMLVSNSPKKLDQNAMEEKEQIILRLTEENKKLSEISKEKDIHINFLMNIITSQKTLTSNPVPMATKTQKDDNNFITIGSNYEHKLL